MTATDPAQRLREAAQRKSSETRARVLRALVAMEARGQTINFNTVAAEARVSKGYLYKQVDLRHRIASARRTPTQVVSPRAPQSERDDTAEQKLWLASEAIQRLKVQVADLERENARLRGDVVALRRRQSL